MPNTITKCPICSKNELVNLTTIKDYSVSQEDFNISKCKTCGFLFTNPIPSESEIGKYYKSEDYISHTDTNKGIINKLYHIIRKRSIQSKIKLINKYNNNKSILDIGCGTGYFLKSCQDNGWTIDGMEPDDHARKLAEKNTNQKIYSKLTEINTSNKYSTITLWHVLEHMHHLDNAIKQIKLLLPKNGILIIAVPNINSYDSVFYNKYWAALDVPRHLYHFRKEDINNLLTKNGFTSKAIHPMPFDSFYVSMLSDKYRFGKTNYLRAFFVGLQSNIKAMGEKNHSSLIYVYQKNDE